MFDMLIKQMLPGVDIEAIQKQAVAVATEVVQTVRRIEEKQDRIIALLHTLHAAQDVAQGATVPHQLTEGNQSHEQRPNPPGNAHPDPASAGSAAPGADAARNSRDGANASGDA